MPSHEENPDLGELFHATFRGLRRAWAQQLAPWELTPHQWRALLTLLRHHPDAQARKARGNGAGNGAGSSAHGHSGGKSGRDVRLKDLAERLNIAPRSATEVVDQLEAKGLVRRAADATDRRATLIVATSTGVELFLSIQAERREQSNEFFSRLSEDERTELARLLALLRA